MIATALDCKLLQGRRRIVLVVIASIRRATRRSAARLSRRKEKLAVTTFSGTFSKLAILGRLIRPAIVAASLGICASALAQAVEIDGAGATFPYPVYAKWAEAYKAKTGVTVNYQSIGSGGGIKQIQAKTVDFGASDMPLTAEELEKYDLLQWPMIMGGAVPVINVEEIELGTLKLDGPTLAQIYLGEVKKWSDPAIANLNPGMKLPSTAIAPVYRSDGSGTTFLFTDYLSKVSPQFKEKVGSATAVQWPTGLGGKGNEGVAALTARTLGAIGYVEYAYVKQNKLNYAQLKNAAGHFVSPSTDTFQAAAANADWEKAPGFHVVLTNQPGEKSWPITGASFILMHKHADRPEKAKAALQFFDWAYKNGQQMAEELDYVAMPDKVVSLVENTWKQIRGPNGEPIWTGS
jgi:phosphate transport system substrate-binding protein